ARAGVMRTAKPGGRVWCAGGELVATRWGLDLAMPQATLEGEPARPDDPMDTATSFRGEVITEDAATWTSLAANIDPRVRVTTGVRVDSHGGRERVRDPVVQPRAELAVAPHPGLAARASAGISSRPAQPDSG